jgi:hypothetical protein
VLIISIISTVTLLCKSSFCLVPIILLYGRRVFAAIYELDASLICYACIGTHPGCGLNSFGYQWNRGKVCSRRDDRCVKLIERRGSKVLVTRDCLSSLEGHRVDIPADKYEGCRAASVDTKLGQYTFNRVKELDTKRYIHKVEQLW